VPQLAQVSDGRLQQAIGARKLVRLYCGRDDLKLADRAIEVRGRRAPQTAHRLGSLLVQCSPALVDGVELAPGRQRALLGFR
jgi:hypothetical protein